MTTRIEIFKNNKWIPLLLNSSGAVKYNAVINRIASLSQREISHTNTFSLPYVYQNIEALDINIFNLSQLANSLNNKYRSRYYVEDKLLQQGYIVVNNTNEGTINVNFIDEALKIVELWGSITFYELLNSETINIPLDYRQSIELMKSYSMSRTSILSPLASVGTRGYNLAKFPNNLNSIGDKFQENINNIRLTDTFNPYQSRPIFNVKSLFDLSIESFGYTPDFDNSVDWSRLEKTYMIEKDLSQGQKNDTSIVTTTFPIINSSNYFSIYTPMSSLRLRRTNFTYSTSPYTFYPNDFSRPIEIQGGVHPVTDYKSVDRCVLVIPEKNQSVGELNWKADLQATLSGTNSLSFQCVAVWSQVPDIGYIYSDLVLINNSTDVTKIDLTLEKDQLSTKPQYAQKLIGITLTITTLERRDNPYSLTNLVHTQTNLPVGIVSYDKYDQYEADIINLTHAAPRVTLKELLSSIMQKEGILMSFDNQLKTIKLFSYGAYLSRKQEGNFSDWSKYHQEYDPSLFSTNYGNEYAKINEIGLGSPYKGNTYKLLLANQGLDSKYKDYIENYSSKFKDVEAIQLINNETTPYYEYTNKGLGLVEVSETGLGSLTQVRANGSSQGTFSGLTPVYNVNGQVLPVGVLDWYNIIDTAVKCESTFLLPVEVVKNLDLSLPIYVGGLGGFYIIEEVPEYTNSTTPVRVKLIKLTIESGFSSIRLPDYSDDFSSLDYSK